MVAAIAVLAVVTGLGLLIRGPARVERASVACSDVAAPRAPRAGRSGSAAPVTLERSVPARSEASAPRVADAPPTPPSVSAHDAGACEPGVERRHVEEVLVRGRVRRFGLPVVGYDLWFRRAGEPAGAEPSEWDFTDQEGRFEVLLAPGSYVVNGDDDTWREELVVSGTAARIESDLRIP